MTPVECTNAISQGMTKEFAGLLIPALGDIKQLSMEDTCTVLDLSLGADASHFRWLMSEEMRMLAPQQLVLRCHAQKRSTSSPCRTKHIQMGPHWVRALNEFYKLCAACWCSSRQKKMIPRDLDLQCITWMTINTSCIEIFEVVMWKQCDPLVQNCRENFS